MEENISELTKVIYLYGRPIQFLLITILAVFLCLTTIFSPTDTLSKGDIKYLKMKYPGQEIDTWLAFDRGLKDVREFNRPVNFILLHTKNEVDVTKNLLKDAAKYFTLNLQDNETEPIVLTPDILNSPKFLRDHGEVIASYVELLRERSVMVVENLEDVASEPARAFHSFCDEYSPIVEKSVIIFTVEVVEFPKNCDDYLQNFLQERWPTISKDIFMALYTRISNMILKINSESEVMSNNNTKSSLDAYWGALSLLIIFLTVFLIVYIEFALYLVNPEFRKLLQKYSFLSDSICDCLLNVQPLNHYFVMNDAEEFYEDLTSYIKNRSGIKNNCLIITKNNLAEFCNNIQEKTLPAKAGVIFIHDIEKFSGKLHEMFKSNEHVKNFLKSNENTFFVYKILSRENWGKELEDILDAGFYNSIPSSSIKIVQQNC